MNHLDNPSTTTTYQRFVEGSERKLTRWLLIVLTIIYSTGVPFVFWSSMYAFLNFDTSGLHLIGTLLMFALFLSIPLSLLGVIWQMWSKYRKNQYRTARWLWTIPFFVIGFVVFLSTILNILINH